MLSIGIAELIVILVLILPFVVVGLYLTYRRESASYPDYAGFWKRSAAKMIDVAIELPFFFLSIKLTEILASPRVYGNVMWGEDVARKTAETAGTIGQLFFWLVHWLYCALLESSSYQATLAKVVLRIRVIDLHGRRIGFGQASVRHIAALLSIVPLCLGYIMAGVTKRKQALHDIVSRCLVVTY